MSKIVKAICLPFFRQFVLPLFLGVFLLNAHSSVAQTATGASGVVVDAVTGEALPYSTVQFENKPVGTRTDFEGRFSLEIKEPARRLKITYVGYQPMFVELKPGQANNDLVVRMQEGSQTP